MPKFQFREKLSDTREHRCHLMVLWSFPGFPSFMKSRVIDDNSQEFLTSCLMLCSPGLAWGHAFGHLLEQHHNILELKIPEFTAFTPD